jgi:hypothetical protein
LRHRCVRPGAYLDKLGFAGIKPAATGRSAYHPAALQKLYVYGRHERMAITAPQIGGARHVKLELPAAAPPSIACGKEMRLASVVPIAKDRVLLLPVRQRTPAQYRECRQKISGDAERRLMVAGRGWLRAMPAIRNMSPVRAFLTGSVFAVSATLPFAEAEQRQANGPHFAFHLVQELCVSAQLGRGQTRPTARIGHNGLGWPGALLGALLSLVAWTKLRAIRQRALELSFAYVFPRLGRPDSMSGTGSPLRATDGWTAANQ